MSFFSEKVLKRPPTEEIRGYSPRELEIAKKNYNYGHNVCFYTVMVCFIIWAILCSVFRPDVAHASELVGGDEPIPCDFNYIVVYGQADDGTYGCSFLFDGFYTSSGYSAYNVSKNGFASLEAMNEWCILQIKSKPNVSSISRFDSDLHCGLRDGHYSVSYDTIIYSNFDYASGDVSFPATPFVVHKASTVGGLAAPEIAKATVTQILGLVPLVLGLVVSAIGLRKALAMVFQRLRRA